MAGTRNPTNTRRRARLHDARAGRATGQGSPRSVVVSIRAKGGTPDRAWPAMIARFVGWRVESRHSRGCSPSSARPWRRGLHPGRLDKPRGKAYKPFEFLVREMGGRKETTDGAP